MMVYRPEPPSAVGRRIADADDQSEFAARLVQLAGEVRGIIRDDERLAQRFAELVAASPDSLFAALILTVVARRDADVFIERLNQQLQRIPPVDGKRWQFLQTRARDF
jgi:hypothetical protein